MTTTHVILMLVQVAVLAYGGYDIYRGRQERETRARLDRFCAKCGWGMER